MTPPNALPRRIGGIVSAGAGIALVVTTSDGSRPVVLAAGGALIALGAVAILLAVPARAIGVVCIGLAGVAALPDQSVASVVATAAAALGGVIVALGSGTPQRPAAAPLRMVSRRLPLARPLSGPAAPISPLAPLKPRDSVSGPPRRVQQTAKSAGRSQV